MACACAVEIGQRLAPRIVQAARLRARKHVVRTLDAASLQGSHRGPGGDIYVVCVACEPVASHLESCV